MKHINRITALLVIILFAVAFVLSFHAIMQLAADNGISYPVLYPFVVDFSIVVFAMFRLRNSLRASSTRLDFPLILLATVISVAFNVLHAPSTLLAQFMAGLIPVVLFASFELLLWMLEQELKTQQHRSNREAQWRTRTRAVVEAARSARAGFTLSDSMESTESCSRVVLYIGFLQVSP